MKDCYIPILGRVIIPAEPHETFINEVFTECKEDINEVHIFTRRFKIYRTTYENLQGNILKIRWRIDEIIDYNFSYAVSVDTITKFFKLLHLKPINDTIMDTMYQHIAFNPLTTNELLCPLDFQFRKLTTHDIPKAAKRRRSNSEGQRPAKK